MKKLLKKSQSFKENEKRLKKCEKNTCNITENGVILLYKMVSRPEC